MVNHRQVFNQAAFDDLELKLRCALAVDYRRVTVDRVRLDWLVVGVDDAQLAGIFISSGAVPHPHLRRWLRDTSVVVSADHRDHPAIATVNRVVNDHTLAEVGL